MAPKLSVIIPVYNRADILTDCIRSLQTQTVSDFEILLIDDGSTDDTLSLCHKLTREDDRIHVLQQKHSGISAARNRGLDAATGEYIFFVDSDDAVHPLLAETLLLAMETQGAAMGGSRYHNVRHEDWHTLGDLIARTAGPGETSLLTNLEAINATCWGNTPFSAMGGVVIRRDWIGTTRFRTDLYIGEDQYFLYENLLKGSGVIFLTPSWYYARIHPEAASNDYTLNGFLTRFHRCRLVWTSEEALERLDNARSQKQDAFALFEKFLRRSELSKADRKTMCQTMKQHKKQLLPALSPSGKFRFRLCLRFPGVARIFLK